MGTLALGRALVKIGGAATAVDASPVFVGNPANATLQAVLTGTGAVSATINWYGSNDGVTGVLLGTTSLSGTNSDSDGLAPLAQWPYIGKQVTAISGTSASVACTAGRVF